MTEDEQKYIQNLKYNAFMGTIAVCVIYGIIAILMILYINLTESGKILYDDLKPFALTFIFGTLFIIIAITVMVVYWEPEQDKKLKPSDLLQNPYSCPDYYKLVTTEDADITKLKQYSSNIASKATDDPDDDKLFIGLKTDKERVNLKDYTITDSNSNLVTNKCTLDADIMSTLSPDNNIFIKDSVTYYAPNAATTDTLIATDQKDKKSFASFTTMYGGYDQSYVIKKPDSGVNVKYDGTTDTPFTKYDCGTVYPEYLSYLDAKEFINNNEKGPKNLHRCEWSKKCKVPWSSAGCD